LFVAVLLEERTPVEELARLTEVLELLDGRSPEAVEEEEMLVGSLAPELAVSG
jgi:hypothetical protein